MKPLPKQELYKRTINLDPDVPVLISMGGWTDSTGDKYSKMVGSPSSRKNFISKAVQFLKQYGFAGLHFDWNYPVCWQSDCKKGPAKDKNNFATFIEVSSSRSLPSRNNFHPYLSDPITGTQ